MAAQDWGWTVNETPVFIGPGDQRKPVPLDRTIFYSDFNRSLGGWLVKKDLYNGLPEESLYGPGIPAGPDADSTSVVWQNSNNQVCRRPIAGGSDQCLSSFRAYRLAVSGNYAITGGGSSTIRLFDFSDMSSKIVDQSTLPGMRYDPDIDGSQAVWIKERGYAGRYYEPLIVLYDVNSGISIYMTKQGGGTVPGGASKYQRKNPVISNGRILYQERINEAGRDWNISAASLGTLGITMVGARGDQINPSLSGNIVVYQDNRTGHPDETGKWVGEWNIYMMDLETGIEQPVCTAPGDQTNPEIRGNIITWEDKRSGDWDIYAAVLAPAEADMQLMQSFAPTLVFDRDEDFRPVEAAAMVAAPGTTLMEGNQERLRSPETLTLDAMGGFGADSYLDLAGACVVCGSHLPDPDFDRYIYTQYVKPYNVIVGSGIRQGVYGRVVRQGDRTVIQYWLNYYFNNHPMLSHEGDWELIEVELDRDGQPARVSASQHAYGKIRRWRDTETRGGHPVIYVAKGSHANYFDPGDHAIELGGIPTPVAVDETDGLATGRVMETTVMPLPGTAFDIPGFRWLNFKGSWGEENGNPAGDAPLGPVWSGDRWNKPFSWERLEWDGFDGIRGMVAGLKAHVGGLVKIDLFDSAGGHVGEDAQGSIEKTISGSQYLEAPEINQKAVIAPFDGSTEYRLKLSADAAVLTPLNLTLADPDRGTLTTLVYYNVPLGAGATATLTMTKGANPAELAIHLDADNDGVADATRMPDEKSELPLDYTPPSTIGDLNAERLAGGSVRLRWSAPGDDGATGSGTMYAIRFSSEPLSEENWASSEPAPVSERPLDAGSDESVDIGGLPDGNLYIAMKTTDDAGNESGLSNVAMCAVEPPRLTLALGATYWKSYADYLMSRLTVRYTINNEGSGSASEVAIRQIITVPAEVTVADPYPEAIASLVPGQSADIEVAFIVPQGIRSFNTSLSASCRDGSGEEIWFGRPPG
ncbi:MAG: hypothetical protein WC935_01510 [Thermoleophilia bacterium]